MHTLHQSYTLGMLVLSINTYVLHLLWQAATAHLAPSIPTPPPLQLPHWIFISNCDSWQEPKTEIACATHTIVTSPADKDFLFASKKPRTQQSFSLATPQTNIKLYYIYILLRDFSIFVARQLSSHKSDLIEKGNTYLSILLHIEYANCKTSTLYWRHWGIGVLKEI